MNTVSQLGNKYLKKAYNILPWTVIGTKDSFVHSFPLRPTNALAPQLSPFPHQHPVAAQLTPLWEPVEEGCQTGEAGCGKSLTNDNCYTSEAAAHNVYRFHTTTPLPSMRTSRQRVVDCADARAHAHTRTPRHICQMFMGAHPRSSALHSPMRAILAKSEGEKLASLCARRAAPCHTEGMGQMQVRINQYLKTF
jgi:hypothetical protein